ncbi:MAG: cell division protein ZapA [Rikenellaceae bacterium]
MDKEEIRIVIASKSYTLKVDSAKRELYHLAERRANAAIVKFEKQNVTTQDAIALVAFNFAVTNIKMRQQSEVDDAELQAIKQIDERVESYLNDIAIER